MQQVSLLLQMFMLRRIDLMVKCRRSTSRRRIKRPEELINKALDTSRKPFVARDGNRKVIQMTTKKN